MKASKQCHLCHFFFFLISSKNFNINDGYLSYLLCRYYAMYGHDEKLAEEIKKGASSVEGVEVKLWQVCILYHNLCSVFR